MNPLTQFKKIPVLPLLVALALVALASPAVALGEAISIRCWSGIRFLSTR
jgi:hypothetical protein